nr:hypothetical protein [Mycolicibacterium septicum]
MLTALCYSMVLSAPASHADPSDGPNDTTGSGYERMGAPDYDRPAEPLPVMTPTPSNWVPKTPYPYDQTQGRVPETDITAEREMCQWFNAQYDELIRQIKRLQFHRITPNGPGVTMGAGTDWDYSVGDLQHEADIVIGNIDQSVAFLTPRAQALSQPRDLANDVYFPVYEGESFYLLWQHLANVSAGISSHQPDWFTGPSLQRVLRWGSRIHRSHVCDQA